MKTYIYRINRAHRVRRETVNRLARSVMSGEGCSVSRANIVLGDNALLKRLNLKFFGKDRPTNVISFKIEDLAEVYVSLDQARDAADVYYFIVHGLLHVAGHDHLGRSQERRMHDRCRDYLDRVIGGRRAR